MQIGSEDFTLDLSLEDYTQGLLEMAAGLHGDGPVPPELAKYFFNRAVEMELMGDTPDAKSEDESETPSPMLGEFPNLTSSVQTLEKAESYIKDFVNRIHFFNSSKIIQQLEILKNLYQRFPLKPLSEFTSNHSPQIQLLLRSLESKLKASAGQTPVVAKPENPKPYDPTPVKSLRLKKKKKSRTYGDKEEKVPQDRNAGSSNASQQLAAMSFTFMADDALPVGSFGSSSTTPMELSSNSSSNNSNSSTPSPTQRTPMQVSPATSRSSRMQMETPQLNLPTGDSPLPVSLPKKSRALFDSFQPIAPAQEMNLTSVIPPLVSPKAFLSVNQSNNSNSNSQSMVTQPTRFMSTGHTFFPVKQGNKTEVKTENSSSQRIYSDDEIIEVVKIFREGNNEQNNCCVVAADILRFFKTGIKPTKPSEIKALPEDSRYDRTTAMVSPTKKGNSRPVKQTVSSTAYISSDKSRGSSLIPPSVETCVDKQGNSYLSIKVTSRDKVGIHFEKLNEYLINLAKNAGGKAAFGTIGLDYSGKYLKDNEGGHEIVFYVRPSTPTQPPVVRFIEAHNYNGITKVGKNVIYNEITDSYNFVSSKVKASQPRNSVKCSDKCFVLTYHDEVPNLLQQPMVNSGGSRVGPSMQI